VIRKGDVIEVVDCYTRHADGAIARVWANARVWLAYTSTAGRHICAEVVGAAFLGNKCKAVMEHDEGKTWREVPLLDRLAAV